MDDIKNRIRKLFVDIDYLENKVDNEIWKITSLSVAENIARHREKLAFYEKRLECKIALLKILSNTLNSQK